MFPIPWNKAFRKKDGTVVNIVDAMSGGGGGSDLPPHSSSDAGKVLTVADDGTLEWDESGSGGGEYLLAYDYTKFGSRTISNVVYSEDGALINTGRGEIPLYITFNNISLFVDVDTLKLSAGENKRFIMGDYNKGLVYRSTGAWGFYGGTSDWEMTELTDGNLFDGSTVKVYIDSDNKWHIYKYCVLIFEPNNALSITAFTIGSHDDYSIQGGIITGARIYNGNYTE